MEHFLERNNLPKLKQGGIDNLDGPLFIKENKPTMNKLPERKA